MMSWKSTTKPQMGPVFIGCALGTIFIIVLRLLLGDAVQAAMVAYPMAVWVLWRAVMR